jgi:hypothetical protein
MNATLTPLRVVRSLCEWKLPTSILVFGFAWTWGAGVPARAWAETYLLRPAQAPGWHQQVKVVVETKGDLKLNPDGSAVKHMPLEVTAELAYVERTLAAGPAYASARTVRNYSEATANLKLRETTITSSLRDDRRLFVSESGEKLAATFSPLGPLTRDELDLVDVPGSGLALAALLPQRALPVNQSWQIPDWAAARLLGLEAVNQHDLTGKLTEVKEHIATIELVGKVAGAVGGVSSEIDLKGKLNFDLQQRAVTWLVLGFTENRAIGHAQPGYNVATKVRLVASPIAPTKDLADPALARLPLQATGETTLIDFTAESAGYQLTHDRRWGVMADRHDVTILRLIDRGDLIAQCNISRLPQLAAGEQLALEAFQDDVRKTLGKNFGQIVEASQESLGDLRSLRVVVSGTAAELPIQWMYYHLSDAAGNRVALVFTIEGSLVEKHPQIERELVNGLRFVATKKPTPAAAGPELKSAESGEGPIRK